MDSTEAIELQGLSFSLGTHTLDTCCDLFPWDWCVLFCQETSAGSHVIGNPKVTIREAQVLPAPGTNTRNVRKYRVIGNRGNLLALII